jgi:putative ABC transport system permease protein
VLQDLRHALRLLRARPAFALVATLTLALGIGANTAVFSVLDAAVLRPLPYADPTALCLVSGTNPHDGQRPRSATRRELDVWRAQLTTFTVLAAASAKWNEVLTIGGDESAVVPAVYVSANLLDTLGVTPILGRNFEAAEDLPGGPPAVVLSHAAWQRRFGGDPSVIGTRVTVEATGATIVGVLPAGVHFLDPTAELWLPLARNPSTRTGRLLSVVGRLAAGVTIEQARAELATVAARLAAQSSEEAGVRLEAVPLLDQRAQPARPALWLLLGAVTLVLLIACANVANLLLVRSLARRRELAIRTALGAGRGRLVRQLLTEGMLLSLLGGSGGVLLARWGIDLVLAATPIPLAPGAVTVDGRVLAFTVALSLLTGLVFSLAPAWQALSVAPQSALQESSPGATAGGRRRRLSGALVVAEVALALVLLVSAGLLLRSFTRLVRVDPGFSTRQALAFHLHLSNAGLDDRDRRNAFYQQLEQRLLALPGVTALGSVSRLPLMPGRGNPSQPLEIQGRALVSAAIPEIDVRNASTGYLAAMRVPLLRGQLAETGDEDQVLINEEAARRFWPGLDPLGQRVRIGGRGAWQAIAGVVGGVRHLGLETAPRPEIYFVTRSGPFANPIFVLRTSVDPHGVLPAVRAAIRELNPGLALSEMQTLDELVEQSTASRRSTVLLLGLFAAVALLLAAIGLYGVLSYAVGQRTQEIGVRMALGARPGDVLRLVVKDGMSLAAAGVAAGWLLALVLTRLLSGALYGITATDPFTFAAVSLLLALVALLACYLPARRATKLDPMLALRRG